MPHGAAPEAHASAAHPLQFREPVTNEARSVLVVDDEPAMREMLVSLLEEAGIGACSAASADEALKSSRERDYDAVLSDIRMPEKDGVALLGELREARPETPVILMTAFGSIDS